MREQYNFPLINEKADKFVLSNEGAQKLGTIMINEKADRFLETNKVPS